MEGDVKRVLNSILFGGIILFVWWVSIKISRIYRRKCPMCEKIFVANLESEKVILVDKEEVPHDEYSFSGIFSRKEIKKYDIIEQEFRCMNCAYKWKMMGRKIHK